MLLTLLIRHLDTGGGPLVFGIDGLMAGVIISETVVKRPLIGVVGLHITASKLE